ncbi:hypothetical protein X801_02895, partial [Opisthorchis viverrini]
GPSVVGVRNARIQQRLLADSNSTLETAYDTAVALEAVENNANLLQPVQPILTSESVDLSPQVNQIQQSSNSAQFKYYRCGGHHTHPKDCWHTQTVCNCCKKRGHLAKASRLAPAFETNAALTNQVMMSEIPEYILHTASTKRVQPLYQVEPQVHSAPVVFELNTGSAATLCSEKSWQNNLGPTVEDKLQQAPVRLRRYTREQMKLLEMENVNVSYKGVTVNGRKWSKPARTRLASTTTHTCGKTGLDTP